LILVFKKWNKNIPIVLIVVLLGTVGVYLFDLKIYGVELVGEVPQGLPSFGLPDVKLEYVQKLWPIALALALVGYLEAISNMQKPFGRTAEMSFWFCVLLF